VPVFLTEKGQSARNAAANLSPRNRLVSPTHLGSTPTVVEIKRETDIIYQLILRDEEKYIKRT
jgi:hypothetical protein